MAAEHVLWAWAAAFVVYAEHGEGNCEADIGRSDKFFMADQVKNEGLNLWRMPIDRAKEFQYSTGYLKSFWEVCPR